MFKKLKFIIYTRAFGLFAYHLIRLYSLTFRFKVTNEEQWKSLLKKGRPILLCAWHQQFFSAIRYFKTYAMFDPGLMISRSKDGDLIACVANRSGWHTPRGSSSRDGKKAMNAMIDHLKHYGFGAHILDGPTGPMGKIKPGIIKMARESGALVVPFYTRAEKAWFFHSWDRFMLPKPFSKVTLTFGDIIDFDLKPLCPDFEIHRQFLEKTMLPRLFHKPT